MAGVHASVEVQDAPKGGAPSPDNARGLRLAALGAAAATVAAGLAWTALRAGAADGAVRALLEARLGRPVAFARLRIRGAPDGARLTFSDLRLGQPARFGPGELLRAAELDLTLRLAPLLAGRLEAPEVRLTTPQLSLRRHGPGEDNWTFGHGGGGSSFLGATRRLEITGGRVSMDDPQRGLTLQGTFSSDPAAAPLPLRLEGGGVLKGAPYTVAARAGPLNGRKPGAPHRLDVTLVDGATRVRLAGTAQAPFDFRGLDVDLTAQGPNLADLDYLFGLLAPNSPPFSLTAHMRRRGHDFEASRIQGRLGDSDVQGDVRSAHAQRRRVDAVLRSRRLTAHDLGVLLASPPPHTVARSTPGVSGVGRTPKGKVFSQTPVSLRRLGDMDGSLDYRAAEVTGYGKPITDGRVKLGLDQGRLRFAPLAFGLGGGAVRVDYDLDARAAKPRGQLAAHLRGVQIAQVRRRGGFSGRLDGDIEVQGAGASLAQQAATSEGRAAFRLSAGALPKIDAAALDGDVFGLVGAALAPKSRTPLRCATAEFAIGGGVARATRLVVATSEGSATGGGEVDLRSEQVRLSLQASAAGRRPALQLRTPITLTGPLGAPHASAKAPSAPSVVSGVLSSLRRLVRPPPPPPVATPGC